MVKWVNQGTDHENKVVNSSGIAISKLRTLPVMTYLMYDLVHPNFFFFFTCLLHFSYLVYNSVELVQGDTFIKIYLPMVKRLLSGLLSQPRSMVFKKDQ